MRNRRGFTLIEIMLALVIGSVIGVALTKLIMSETRFFNKQQAIRDARSASRAALNVILSDLRMVEIGNGVVSATNTDVTLRVPYAFGIVCAANALNMTVALFPIDSATSANAGLSGYAWRDTLSGAYTYVDGATRAAGVLATCTGASITPVANSSIALMAPGNLLAQVGTPVFLYQRIRYYFANSTALPGRTGLYRSIIATSATDELVTPMQSSSAFNFYVVNADTAQTAVPALLTTIRGLQLVLNGASAETPPGRSSPQPFNLTTAVFFQNRQN